MVFFLEITNIWQKCQVFWFADFFHEIFVIDLQDANKKTKFFSKLAAKNRFIYDK
jgi:hypothetical protein